MWNIINENMVRYRGLSTDEKPDVTIGSEFFEIDTGKTYLYSGSEWLEQPESGGGGSSVDVVELNVSSNDTYTAPSGKAYSPVVVNVPDTPAVVESLSVTENGTYTAPAGTDGYSPVTVDVPLPVINSLSITQNGTYTAPTGVNGYSPITVSVSGGGGASNVVTGTFKGTTTGAAMDVALNYTGNGYPVAVVIYPTEGTYNSVAGTGSYYNLIQRYAANYIALFKIRADETPTYNTDEPKNYMSTYIRHKSSDTSSTQYSGNSTEYYYIMQDSAATSTRPCVTLRSKTKMSVYIASSSYGFAANIDYTYYVIYSS